MTTKELLGYENQSLKCEFGSRRGGKKGRGQGLGQVCDGGCQEAATSWRSWKSCRREPHTFPEEECPDSCFGNCTSSFSSHVENTNELETLQSPAGSSHVTVPMEGCSNPRGRLMPLLTRRGAVADSLGWTRERGSAGGLH